MKRNQLLIGGAAVLAVVLLWYFVLYKPLGDDLSSAQAQTAAEQKKTDGLHADLARLQAQAKNAPQQQALLRTLDAAVPKEPDLAEFIIQANDIADQSGISFLSIAPSPPVAGTSGTASVINVTISIGGSFFQLQDYLRLLEKLERLVIVDGITISASSASSSTSGSSTSGSGVDTSSSGGTPTLSVTLTARMFTRAAPTGAAAGSSPTTPGATTPTTTPGETTTTTAPANSGSSTTGGT